MVTCLSSLFNRFAFPYCLVALLPISIYLRMDFTGQILQWYHENKRELPWRKTTDPYLIWVSEILLQQTRIGQGLPYYERFIRVFPSAGHLAKAEEEEVLKLWQGLGYYSRARNMHRAARMIMNQFEGRFPDTYLSILSLPGVGDYTAAAIASIAFHLPHAVVDGNVIRFLSRYYGITEPAGSSKSCIAIKGKASVLMDPEHPGTFNQAMMEYGARVCLPVSLQCQTCIFNSGCFAFQHMVVDQLPVKRISIKQKLRYFNYLVFHKEGSVSLYLKKRVETDIWKGMYDFPLIETEKPVSVKILLKHPSWIRMPLHDLEKPLKRLGELHHVLTHQRIIARFYKIWFDPNAVLPQDWVEIKDLEQIPVPRLIEKFIQHTLPSDNL